MTARTGTILASQLGDDWTASAHLAAEAAANAWPATGDLVIVTAGFEEPDTATYRITARLDGGRFQLTDTATGETGYAAAWQLAPAGD